MYYVFADVPNAGRKLVTLPKRLDWDTKFLKHIKDLDAKKPVILCGDLNVAHKEIGSLFDFFCLFASRPMCIFDFFDITIAHIFSYLQRFTIF